MNRLKHIKELKAYAEKLKLENCEIISKYSMRQLCAIYNGIGPEAFPEWLRDFVTKINADLEAAAFIHDIEWHESDCSPAHFRESNERLARNGVAIASDKYAWYDPRRYLLAAQSRKFGKICQKFGWSAWNAASTERANGKARKR